MDEIFERPLLPIDIDIDIDIQIGDNFNGALNTRYINPPTCYEIPEARLKYSDANKLAKSMEIKKNSRFFCFVDGKFVFGDFIEALIVHNNYEVEELTISTLSMNQNNVDSLQNLIKGDFVKKLNLIVSDYFFSHERRGLVSYIYQELDIEDKFQLAVASSHCKTATIKTANGGFIVIHGSANLRSSSNIEQFAIEESQSLFNFVDATNKAIIEKYKTIDKSVRNSTLWKTITFKD